MKKRFFLLSIVFFALSVCAEVHISVGDARTWSTQELAQYVGQTVVFDDPLIVCNNASSSLTVSPWRMFEPLSQGAAGTAENSLANHVNSSCWFYLTDVPSRSDSNPYRCGEKIYNLKAKVNSTGSLTWVSGEWRGNKRADLEAGLPDLGEYRLLVCAFNVENYFVENLGSQYLGANNYSEHQRQRAKISKALKKINADVFGLVELEEGNAAIQEIVSDLNQNLPGRDYKFFESSSGSSQKSDFVYDANKVEPIGTPSEIDTELINRKKMLAFREKATGEKFIYSINHFKSMNTGDEYRRVKEATAVVDFYKKYSQNGSVRDKDVLFMGDLNCYAKTEPIYVFTNIGMIDMHRAFHADSSYSYRMRGGSQFGYIDHALCNETMYPQITGMAVYHINSDETDNYNYKNSYDNTMFRCSDHDPVLVGLKLDSTLVYDPSPTINSAEILNGESATIVIQNAHKDGQKSFYTIYSINGTMLVRQPITSLYHEVEMPTAAGVYIVYVYFDGQVYQRKLIVR